MSEKFPIPSILPANIGMKAFQTGIPARDRTVQELTLAISRGSTEAFEVFYAEYSPRVYRLLFVVTRGHEQLTQDLHQVVMIKAASKLPALPSEQSLWAWLAQVARNAFRDCLRRDRHEHLNIPITEAVPALVEPPRRETDLVYTALAELSTRERELVELFYFDDLAQSEMARRSGRTVKSIQSELARIRKKLQRALLKLASHEKRH